MKFSSTVAAFSAVAGVTLAIPQGAWYGRPFPPYDYSDKPQSIDAASHGGDRHGASANGTSTRAIVADRASTTTTTTASATANWNDWSVDSAHTHQTQSIDAASHGGRNESHGASHSTSAAAAVVAANTRTTATTMASSIYRAVEGTHTYRSQSIDPASSRGDNDIHAHRASTTTTTAIWNNWAVEDAHTYKAESTHAHVNDPSSATPVRAATTTITTTTNNNNRHVDGTHTASTTTANRNHWDSRGLIESINAILAPASNIDNDSHGASTTSTLSFAAAATTTTTTAANHNIHVVDGSHTTSVPTTAANWNDWVVDSVDAHKAQGTDPASHGGHSHGESINGTRSFAGVEVAKTTSTTTAHHNSRAADGAHTASTTTTVAEWSNWVVDGADPYKSQSVDATSHSGKDSHGTTATSTRSYATAEAAKTTTADPANWNNWVVDGEHTSTTTVTHKSVDAYERSTTSTRTTDPADWNNWVIDGEHKSTTSANHKSVDSAHTTSSTEATTTTTDPAKWNDWVLDGAHTTSTASTASHKSVDAHETSTTTTAAADPANWNNWILDGEHTTTTTTNHKSIDAHTTSTTTAKTAITDPANWNDWIVNDAHTSTTSANDKNVDAHETSKTTTSTTTIADPANWNNWVVDGAHATSTSTTTSTVNHKDRSVHDVHTTSTTSDPANWNNWVVDEGHPYSHTTTTIAAVAATTSTTSTSSTSSHSSTACLSHAAASSVVNSFASLLTAYDDATAEKLLSPSFTDSSDSTNFLAGKPLGSATFASKRAFQQGQGQAAQPSTKFNVLSIDAVTCDVIAFRWEAVFANTGAGAGEGAGVPVKGINILHTVNPTGAADGWQIERVFSEFNSAVWTVGAGGSCAPPPAQQHGQAQAKGQA
ncbi:hypothetical protein AYO20_09421 [Fonsecaea nubica]|uniref:NTF2-like domain-containing protein n=1 Tax=Fonsecaea nubica TaxID=856822 RepID=A0A178CHG4_9EURO|nr:hypothetical protein AYO20_09421 [Fonsecaea nubica]OAL28473.1 hypothetical protein AYO20_09421 [Fonsecaea nubica]